MNRSQGRLVGLVVLDGWGINPKKDGNAVALARTPVMDALLTSRPSATLTTCGEAVGLPVGQMGNSEVGHLNLGAGRIVYQDLTRIDQAVRDGSLGTNPVWGAALDRARGAGTLHLIGLLSNGGVHSHERHLAAMIRQAVARGVTRIRVQAFLDGRDTAPRSAGNSIRGAEAVLREAKDGRIATISGRYFAMDRDKRWERTEKAYRAMVNGEGRTADSAEAALEEAYARGESDEFVDPTVVRGTDGSIRSGDTVVAFNFRPDRMRQISRALADPAFDGFARPGGPPPIHYVCMTEYDETFRFPVVFTDEPLKGTIGEVVSRAGIRQLRIAETEKYAHVTYFFNGSEERPFEGEDRALIPSSKVATYDLKPEMSAREVTDEVVRRLTGEPYGFFVLNYANADMVGHTGVLDAAIRAVETVDGCLGRVLEAVESRGGIALVTADHGNAEQMIDEATGGPHTAHTLNPVPILAAGHGPHITLQSGILADVAPTLIELLGLKPSPEMTGTSLIRP